MSEWFKELVLKTSDSERGQGFESLSLRQDLYANRKKKAIAPVLTTGAIALAKYL